MNALKQATNFLSSWRNLLALGTLFPLGGWIYSRVWMVNPAILGDEYLYSMNARKAAPWDPSPAGDFSNYLFNFVYQATNICGDAFYTCGKVLNLVFFLGFIFTLFLIAIRFLPFWAAYAFMIAAGLSPLSVYTSMFLPESMYMFFIGLVLVSVLHAIQVYEWKSWALVGLTVGIASLVKPHAWLSAIAVGVTLVVVGLGNRDLGIRKTLKVGLTFIAGAAAGRLALGLMVGGPKALGFFGQYLGLGTIEQVVTGPVQAEPQVIVGTSPMNGVIGLFGSQSVIHILVISALMAISVVGIIVGVQDIFRQKKLSRVSAFALFSFIWLTSLMIEIVIFTGWITGAGDDHTTRVLLRYYEFLFVITPLSGLAVFAKGLSENVSLWLRWGIFGLFAALITPAFTGYFATLTIQIADAPTLAGLVVNAELFNAIAVVSFVSLAVYATFPRFVRWTFLLLLPLTFVGTGWEIQGQYQGFRGSLSSADLAGQYLRDNLSQKELSETWIVATSRFDATNVAIWADSPNLKYELFAAGSQVTPELIPEGKSFVLATGEIVISGTGYEVIEGEGFRLYKVR